MQLFITRLGYTHAHGHMDARHACLLLQPLHICPDAIFEVNRELPQPHNLSICLTSAT